jgi:tetratricopeptide (TPR) repeat protein
VVKIPSTSRDFFLSLPADTYDILLSRVCLTVTNRLCHLRKPLPMFSRLLLFCSLVFSLSALEAQQIRSQAAFRLLQTAQTLMEVQQLEAAEQYFNKGLSRAVANNDTYSQAYAYQGLGTLFSKLEQNKKAEENYQKSLRLYKSLNLPVLANMVESLLKSVQGIGDLYGGVEIGAKGVKLSIIDVKLSRDKQYDYTLVADTSINTDAAELSYKSEKETFDALTIFWVMLKERYRIPAKRIHMVISSGLRQELDKYNKVEYFASVVRPKEMDPAVQITSITPNQEAELSMLGIVPQKHRFTANQLDIGSGNTKGGYFDEARRLVPLTFPLGTKSFQRLVDARESGDIQQFAKAAEQLWKDSIASTVDAELLDKKDLRQKDVFYLSGGIVWAMTCYLYPAEAKKNYVEINGADISEFRRRLLTGFQELTNPASLSVIQDAEVEYAARSNIRRASRTYDQRALTAGAIWLDELMKKVNAEQPNKKFIYPRYGYIGWISGYIIKQVTNQYASVLAASGR